MNGYSIMQRLMLVLTLAGLLSVPAELSAQCSDAGICSIGGPAEPSHVLTFSGGLSYGASTDDELSFKDIHLGLHAAVTDQLSLSASVPYRSISGPLGTTSGIGDLLIAGQYTVWSGSGIAVSVEGGIRVAAGPVNEGGLPQAYQPGLGTTDGLFGMTVAGDAWAASAGYQYAPGRSANTVNQLRRGDDLSFRGSYTLLDDGPRVRGEVIVIHKLQRSDGFYTKTAASSSTFVPGDDGIPDTDRTQVNLVGDVAFPFTDGTSLSLRAAMALLARPVNVDGLKRNVTIQAGISLPLR